MKQFDSEVQQRLISPVRPLILKKQVFLLFFSLIMSLGGFAADRYSVASGTWSSTSTWSATSGGAPGATAPAGGDNVYIQSGTVVTLNVSNSAVTSINNFTIYPSATFNVTGNNLLFIAGNWTNNGAFNAGTGTGTINFNGTNPQSIGGSSVTTFLRFTISNTIAFVSLESNIITNQLITAANSRFNLSSYDLTITGSGTPVTIGTNTLIDPSTSTVNFTNSSTTTIAPINYYNLDLSGGPRTNGSTIRIANILTPGTVTNLGGTVIFNGTGAQNIPSLTYGVLQTSTGGIKTLEGNTTINGNLNVGAGTTLEPASYTLTFTAGNTTPFAVSPGGAFNPSTSTVSYTGNSTVTIAAISYYNLISSNSNRIFPNGQTVSVANNFNPGTGSYTITGSNFVFNGTTGFQTFAPTNPFTFNNLIINNPNGVNVARDVTINTNLNFISGKIVLSGNNFVYLPSSGTVTGANFSSYVDGLLRKQIPNGTSSRVFEIGDAYGFAPVTINFTGTTLNNGVLTLRTFSDDHPQICASLLDKSSSVNRNYYIQNGTGTIVNGYSTSNNSRVTGFSSYNATFNFNPSDIDAGANPNNFIIKRFQTGPPDIWTTPTIGIRTSTSTTFTGQINNAFGFGIFQIAEPEPIIATSAQSPSICYNSATNVLMPSSKIGVSYQLRNSADNSLVGTPINGTGGALSFPTGTLLTTTTFNVLATNTASSCAILMANTTTVFINPGTEKTVTASPALVCVGNAAKVIIGLSQPNVKYVLRNDADNSSLGDTLTGNNGNLEFNIPLGYLVSTTVFNVWAIDTVTSCAAVLLNKVTITTQNLTSPAFDIEQDFCTIGAGSVILATTDSSFTSFLWSNGSLNPSIIIDQSGFYSLTVTDANGCRTTKSINIGDEKVINGDFSQGVGIGYTTGYILNQAPNGLVSPGTGYYAINNNANFTHGNFWGRDHTSKTGNFMIINGDGPARTIWQTTVDVVPNTQYYFSAWALSVNNVGPFAQLQFNINGAPAGSSPILPAGVNNVSNAGWQRFFGSWNSGAISGNITIRIVNLQASSNGNDFGIDDVSFSTLPPVTFFGASVGNGGNNLCLNDTLKLTATLTGGASPISYAWTGPNGFTSTDANPIIFPGEGGMYYLTATEGRNCQSSDSIFIILSDPTLTSVSQGLNKCENNVTITVGGMVPNSLNNTVYYNISGGGTGSGNRIASGLITDSSGNASFILNPLDNALNGRTLRVDSIFNGSCRKPITGVSIVLDVRDSNTPQWVGGISGDWNVATNWCPTTPGTGTNISVPTGTTIFINAGEVATIQNLTLLGTANIVVDEGTLTVFGTVSTPGSGKIDARKGTIQLSRNGNQDISGTNFVDSSINILKISLGGTNAATVTQNLKILDSLTFGNATARMNANGRLIIASSQQKTAKVGRLAAGNVISGDAIVERYISSGRKWRFLSIPTVTTQTFKDAWQEGAAVRYNLPGGNPVPGYGAIIGHNVSGTWESLGFDAYAVSGPTIKTYNPSSETWTGIVGTLEPNKIASNGGYMTFISGHRGLPSPSATSATILRTRGALKQQKQDTITLVANQFTPIGNPYAAPIYMANIAKTSSVQDVFYVWDPRLAQVGGFQTFTRSGSSYEVTPGGGSYGSLFSSETNQIESGQAFFMRAFASNGKIVIEENDKGDDQNLVFRDPSNFVNQQKIVVRLSSIINNVESTLDAAVVRLDESYSNEKDINDIDKIQNANEGVAIIANSNKLVYDSRRKITSTDTIYLHLTGIRIASYEWKISMNQFELSGLTAFLLDSHKKTSTQLSMTGETIVGFNIENIPSSYTSNRFKIIFSPSVVLPVSFTNISAQRNNDRSVSVQWKVENEINMDGYQVERSANGTNFESITGTVAPTNNNAGAAAYQYADLDKVSNDLFYRIKGLSSNGDIQYSAVVKVAGIKTNGNSSISVYPNPVVDKKMNVQFAAGMAGNYQLTLTNNNGSRVYQQELKLNNNSSTQTIALPSSIAAGRYQLQVLMPDGTTQQKSILVL